MSRRHVETITDYLIVAVSPALIMFLVGSMVFFLTHLFYDGDFPGRLHFAWRLRFACAMFVMASVLIARISIEDGREYATLFALPLSVVTILSVLKYTDANLLIILPLVAFVWWSTDKLTWDCTVVDDQEDTSGEGLLQTIGMDDNSAVDADTEQATTDTSQAEATSLWQKWVRHRHRPHTPGVWVVYFGIGGLPLFGLGQLAIDPAVRPMGFLLLCIFVASTLSLLMTTSFLQMRRYLLQRRLPFTDQMASIWLGTGGVLIVGLMLFALLLPRPQTGYSLLESFDRTGTRSDLQASQASVAEDGVEDDAQSGSGTSTRTQQAQATSTDGRQQSRDAAERREGKQGDPAGSSQGRPEEAENNDTSASQQPERPSRSRDQDAASGDAAEPTDFSGQPPPARSPTEDDDATASETQPSSREPSALESPEGREPPSPAFSNPLQNLTFGNMARWLYFLLLAVGVVFVLFRYGREIGAALSAFFQELSALFQRLLGRRSSVTATSEGEDEEAVASPAKPFSSYQDPFLMGTESQFTPQQLVNYTFEALQAWASERDCGRTDEQTPLEFATNISVDHERVGRLARNLAILYNQAAYSPGTLGKDATEHLRSLWGALRGPAQA